MTIDDDRTRTPRLLALALCAAPFVSTHQDSPPAQKEGTGVILGTVTHTTLKKYPALLFIEDIPGRTFPAPTTPAAIDQKDKTFVPRVLPILVGTTVEFRNLDDLLHNVFSPDGEKYDLGNWGKGETRRYTFKRVGVYTQLCAAHPEMVAYAVVLKTPYFGFTNADGHFAIANVPAGTWKLKVWNERLKPKNLEKTYEVKVEAGKDISVTIEL